MLKKLTFTLMTLACIAHQTHTENKSNIDALAGSVHTALRWSPLACFLYLHSIDSMKECSEHQKAANAIALTAVVYYGYQGIRLTANALKNGSIALYNKATGK